MGNTGIPYLKNTANITVGCTHAGSPGCDHCYAEGAHEMRHKAYLAGKKVPEQYARPFSEVRTMPERLGGLRKGKGVTGVCFCSDLFHKDVPDVFIRGAFVAMRENLRRQFVVLTKRSERLLEVCGNLPASLYPHVYLGVTVENQEWADRRLPHLVALADRGWRTFVSYEPSLGLVDFSPWLREWACKECRGTGVVGFGAGCRPCPRFCLRHWRKNWPDRKDSVPIGGIIMGCESGPGRRLTKCEACEGKGETFRYNFGEMAYVEPSDCPRCLGTGYAFWGWAQDTLADCQAARIRYYLKQGPDDRGRVVKHPELAGRQWLETPWGAGAAGTEGAPR